MIYCICGSREHRDPSAIYKLLFSLPAGAQVITGHCATGACATVRQACHELGIPCQVYTPARGRYHSKFEAYEAIRARNEKMIRAADIVHIFYSGELKGGSKHEATLAGQLCKPCRLHGDGAFFGQSFEDLPF
jgi:hypothetical protein